MGDTDKSRIEAADVAAAMALLSRWPIPVNGEAAAARGAGAAWAYPLAGLGVALPAAVVAWVCLALGVPASLSAALAIAVLIVTTGAMHEDGLADCADGFWGGWDRTRRLEIMKDSRIGAYGVLALGLGLLLRWSALTVLLSGDVLWAAIIVPAVLSRAAMVWVMHVLPPARLDGLSRRVGQPDRESVLIAVALAAAAVILLWFSAVVALLLVCGAATLGMMALARSKIGGQTGDVLGATQQVVEIASLVVLATLV